MPPDKLNSAPISQKQSHDCVAGIDIGGTNLRVALADMAGTVIARWAASTVGLQSADLVVRLIRNGVLHLLEQTARPASSLRSVAAGAPGVTNVDTGVVIATSYLMGWRDVPLRAMLEAELGVSAAIDNDVNLGALGESWVGAAAGVQDFIFIAIGTGIGAGVVLRGEIYRGARWTAGEIGYMLVPGVSSEPVGQGQPGALESRIGGEGIKAEWQRLCGDSSAALRDLRATDIFDLATAGSAPAQLILQQTARLLAYAIYNMSLLFDCPLFIFGGVVGRHAALCEATRTYLENQQGGSQPRLELSTLGTDAQLIGAIRLAMNLAQTRGSDILQSRSD